MGGLLFDLSNYDIRYFCGKNLMCGIVGYIGHKKTIKVLLDGIKRLEYRGYDSSGVAFIENAHPHTDCKNEIAVVHNGIIENYGYLKTRLVREGHIFRSETDTEVLAHLIEKYFHGNLEMAVMEALKEVEGTYGIAVISPKDPQKIVAARKGSPLVLGIGQQENS